VDLAASLIAGSDDLESLVSQMKQVAATAITRAATDCKTGKKHLWLHSFLAILKKIPPPF
jgi:hypothetical protein